MSETRHLAASVLKRCRAQWGPSPPAPAACHRPASRGLLPQTPSVPGCACARRASRLDSGPPRALARHRVCGRGALDAYRYPRARRPVEKRADPRYAGRLAAASVSGEPVLPLAGLSEIITQGPSLEPVLTLAAWHSRNKKLKNKTNQQPSLALVLFPRRAFLLGVYFFLDICHPSLPPLLCFFFTLCFFLLFSALSPLFPLSLHFSASSPVFVTRPEPGHLFIWKLELRKEVKISPGTLKQRRGILYSLSWSKDDPSFLPHHKIHFGVYTCLLAILGGICLFSNCCCSRDRDPATG